MEDLSNNPSHESSHEHAPPPASGHTADVELTLDLVRELLSELRTTMTESVADGANVIASVCDEAALSEHSEQIELLLNDLLEVADEAATAATAVPSPIVATPPVAVMSEPECEPQQQPEPQSEAEPEPEAQSHASAHLETPMTAAPAAAPAPAETPVPEPVAECTPLPVAPARPRFSLRRTMDSQLLPVFATISAPIAMVPKALRPYVGVAAITMFVWIPVVWWMAGQVIAMDRVRPLSTAEIEALGTVATAPASDHGDKKDEHKEEAKAPEKKDSEKDKKKDSKKASSSGGH
ncbi:MAG: hypothetical protein SGJ11_06165 [Phycisphaerae bacterium]|nr:hypothetical protein [Phycisphaerae bacterium]